MKEKIPQVEFYYFKPSGKYYAFGLGEWPNNQWQIPYNDGKMWRDKIMEVNDGKMPGMSGRASNYYITSRFPEDYPHGFPNLIPPESEFE
jgi:hypothetical protein